MNKEISEILNAFGFEGGEWNEITTSYLFSHKNYEGLLAVEKKYNS